MAMMLFEVKLICPQTKTVLFTSVNSKPVFPPQHLYDRIPKPLLVILTKDSNGEIKKVA